MRGTKTTTAAMSWTMLSLRRRALHALPLRANGKLRILEEGQFRYDELAKAPKKEKARRNPLDKKLRCAAPRGEGVDSPGGWAK
jgi:hypothetical protein